ncbi:c-type cytochrome domain-containing protein [Algoriphagus zhangzhouensis]|uniref:Uncharacterized membrane protein n=1 Tax=Algoriphagus zhangzhouensis TaxID=1073327 RepID=A0A1M7ZCE4_9BACT|nr:c-type cytochrome domain-containing protein [Algoriphagus zhangzhouensis]TDY45571.1 putative membrane protein [Algoriphagus zhangzhouensis]SHO62575.1 Uncharacterized membrane protein [Algoriphagus zhangzhouensis]
MPTKNTLRNLLENCLFVWVGLSLILTLAPAQYQFPEIIQVTGRAHPLILHFPIVLLLLGLIFFFLPALQKNPEVKEIGEFTFLFGSNLAGITVIAGLILAREEYEGDALLLHQWAGLGVFLLSVLLYFFRAKKASIKTTLSLILAAGIVLTGHWGANLTHGDDFLLAPLKSEVQDLPTLAEAEVFRDMVNPILEAKCLSCHKEGKIKGELRLDHVEGIQKGGKTGPLFVAGDPEKSILFERIHLPVDDKKHMPPKNKAQLSDEEMMVLQEWIAQGGKFDQKVEDSNPESELFQLASLKFEKNKSYDFEAADQETIQELNNFYRLVTPLYPESPALLVSYYGIAAFDPESLKDLKDVKEQVVEINLNKMPLKEVDLEFLKDFPHLEKLSLNFTDIETKHLQAISEIPNLQDLAVSGNAFGEKDFQALENMTGLRKLFLWQKGISDSQKDQLSKSLETTEIDFGFDGSGITYELNPPSIKQDKVFFSDSLKIEITHPIPSTEIRYTLDGSEPDSLNSLIYTNPVWVNSSGKLRAKVFAEDWKGSNSSVTVYMKAGLSPEEYKLLTDPNEKYKAQGARTVFDKVKGKNNHTSGEWLGYSEKPFDIELKHDKSHKIKSLGLSLLYNESAYIFPPTRVQILALENGKWITLVDDHPKPSEKIEEIRSELLLYPIEDSNFEKIRVTVNPITSLPSWHAGAGARGWVFIDELLIN